MVRYFFGLLSPTTRHWIEEQWELYNGDDVGEFVSDILGKGGPHILPVLSGELKDKNQLRENYYIYLKKLLGQETIENILKKELTSFLTPQNNGDN